MVLDINKRRYCVIVYVGNFWPSNFGPISVWSLIYLLISLICTPKYFLCLPQFVFSIRGLLEHVRGVKIRGGGGVGVTQVPKKGLRMCKRYYYGAQFIVPTWSPMMGPSPAPDSTGEWGVDLYGSFMSMTLRPQFIPNC